MYRLAHRYLSEATSPVVLTGAGLSVSSGIPDSPRLDVSDEQYRRDPALRAATFAELRRRARLSPSSAHRDLAAYVTARPGATLITQNTDGLHLAAGLAPDRVVEVHGVDRVVRCLSCQRQIATAELLASDESDEPRCSASCPGPLTPDVIRYGQSVPVALAARAITALRAADVILAVGTSLRVHPLSEMVRDAIYHRARLLIVNTTPTKFDSRAVAVIHADAQSALPRVL